jgi:hypothetical protein
MDFGRSNRVVVFEADKCFVMKFEFHYIPFQIEGITGLKLSL